MEAKIEYEKKQAEIKNELAILNDKLKNHKKIYSKNTNNWGYVGDLSYIINQLKELNKFR
jgi:hypothetical protein